MLRTDKYSSGFSLIEAMVASLLIGISFVGVYGYTSFSSRFLNSSSERQELQLIADQIFNVIDTDKTNIDQYETNFHTCTAPTSGQTQKYITYKYKWCQMLYSKFGIAGTSDVRNIDVSNISGGKLVTITLQTKGKRSQVVSKKFYDN